MRSRRCSPRASSQPAAKPDCATWNALGGDTAGPATVSYTITEGDAKGPFVKTIPPSLPDQAKLPALGYTSALEGLAEKFHTSPAMLQQLNPGAQFTANSQIKVPAVKPFDVGCAETHARSGRRGRDGAGDA